VLLDALLALLLFSLSLFTERSALLTALRATTLSLAGSMISPLQTLCGEQPSPVAQLSVSI
jgi:hypothetical protein